MGPTHASRSYLNQEAMLRAAVTSNADAVQSGYGFLAENAFFAEAVVGAGLNFVGPRPEMIRLIGGKAGAREVSTAIGVPTVAGVLSR